MATRGLRTGRWYEVFFSFLIFVGRQDLSKGFPIREKQSPGLLHGDQGTLARSIRGRLGH